MNEMVKVTSGLTMSSREIAELVGSRHDKVMQSIERLAERGVFTLPPMGEVSNSGPGPKLVKEYRLDKRSSLIAVAQLCPEFTARIVDRWQELEEQVRQPLRIDVRDPSQLATITIQLIEVNKELEVRAVTAERIVEAQKVDVAALDRIAKSEGSLCITDAAKALQVPPRKLFKWLRSHSWIYTRPGSASDIGYQSKIAAGLLEHKVTTVSRTDGSEKTVTQVRITPAGIAKLAKHLGADQPLLV